MDPEHKTLKMTLYYFLHFELRRKMSNLDSTRISRNILANLYLERIKNLLD